MEVLQAHSLSRILLFEQHPILVVSATFSGTDPQRMTMDLGANAFLSVPFDASVLRVYMRALLKEKPKSLKKVIIIEDDLDLSKKIKKTFESFGYESYLVHNTQNARDL